MVGRRDSPVKQDKTAVARVRPVKSGPSCSMDMHTAIAVEDLGFGPLDIPGIWRYKALAGAGQADCMTRTPAQHSLRREEKEEWLD